MEQKNNTGPIKKAEGQSELRRLLAHRQADAHLEAAAEREFNEYTRLLAIANETLTFENASAAARQWGRFLAAYNGLPDAVTVRPPLQ